MVEVARMNGASILFQYRFLLIQKLSDFGVHFLPIFVVHSMVVFLVDSVAPQCSRDVAFCVERVPLDLQSDCVVHRLNEPIHMCC